MARKTRPGRALAEATIGILIACALTAFFFQSAGKAMDGIVQPASDSAKDIATCRQSASDSGLSMPRPGEILTTAQATERGARYQRFVSECSMAALRARQARH